MKRTIIFWALLFSSGLSNASSIEGKIDYLQTGIGWTSDNVYFLVKMKNSRTAKPGCASDERLAVNPATEAGKVIVSMLLAAKAASKEVLIVGTDECGVMGKEFESINYIRFL